MLYAAKTSTYIHSSAFLVWKFFTLQQTLTRLEYLNYNQHSVYILNLRLNSDAFMRFYVICYRLYVHIYALVVLNHKL